MTEEQKKLLNSLKIVKEYLSDDKCRIPNRVLFDFWRIINYSEEAIQRDNAVLALGEALKSLGLFEDNIDRLNKIDNKIKNIECDIEHLEFKNL